jgi:hypothetical protein
MSTQNPQCRYAGKYQRCGDRATTATGEVLLCQTHLDLAIDLARRIGWTITKGTA